MDIMQINDFYKTQYDICANHCIKNAKKYQAESEH